VVEWRLIAIPALLLLASSPVPAAGPPAKAPATSPDKVAILLLPALDSTPDAAHMLAPREAVIRHREEFELISRRFDVLGEAVATKAADSPPRIDLSTPSTRDSDNLDLLAKRAGSDWVAGITVQEVKMDSFDGGQFTIHSRVLLQVWDADNHRWLANGTVVGQVVEGGSPVFAFRDSLEEAVKDALAPLVGDYPQSVSLPNEYGVNDYLAGQTASRSSGGSTHPDP
jgi:hypothetical protein